MQKAQIRHARRVSGARLCALGVGGALAIAAAIAWSAARPMDAIHVVQTLREGGCGGIVPPARRLDEDALLDRAAREWAGGRTLADAAEKSGYLSEKVAGLHVTGPDSAVMQQLRSSSCLTVTDRNMRDVGMYHRGADTWLVLGYKYAVPSSQEAPRLAARMLELVNEARSQPRHCGSRAFAPAPPLRDVSLRDEMRCLVAAVDGLASRAMTQA